MAIPQSTNAPWTRKHDNPSAPLFSAVSEILYPQSLEDLIAICATTTGQIRAAGSHWALSQAAVSDDVFIETHDYYNLFPAMGRTLYEVFPRCLSEQFVQSFNPAGQHPLAGADFQKRYYFHIEAGKRIYQAYAEMDQGDTDTSSLAHKIQKCFNDSSYVNTKWAFPTLGGAGGQTVVGAFSTGTHGGDADRPPLADAVVALHLVVDGGKHFWIERSAVGGVTMTDPDKLRALYGDPSRFGGPGFSPENFEVIYDDKVLNACRVQVGRFGIIYSVVLEVVPQYGLYQAIDNVTSVSNDLSTWEEVKINNAIIDPGSTWFRQYLPDGTPQRFLQIAILPVAIADGKAHMCSVTRRWTVSLSDLATPPQGRAERVGNVVNTFDPRLNAPRFQKAGVSIPYSPTENANASPDFLQIACADASFLAGIIDAVYTEVENFVNGAAPAVGSALATATALGDAALSGLILELIVILAILADFLKILEADLSNDPDGQRLGQVLNTLAGSLLGDPDTRAAGMLVWAAISAEVFKSIQDVPPFWALSYAVMDTHDYTDLSCQVNVDSVEVFFDATDSNIIVFVDRLLQFVTDNEVQHGRTPAGYISLRYTGNTQATIGPHPQLSTLTCAIECSSLVDVAGGSDFVQYATQLALDPNINGVLHWGQRNTSQQSDIEARFGDTPSNPTGLLHDWRAVLSRLTDNGRLNRFSSAFTRQTGLEIVQPIVGAVSASQWNSPPANQYKVEWDCSSNPPETQIYLTIQPPVGAPVLNFSNLGLQANQLFPTPVPGTYNVTLAASLTRNGATRLASKTLVVTV